MHEPVSIRWPYCSFLVVCGWNGAHWAAGWCAASARSARSSRIASASRTVTPARGRVNQCAEKLDSSKSLWKRKRRFLMCCCIGDEVCGSSAPPCALTGARAHLAKPCASSHAAGTHRVSAALPLDRVDDLGAGSLGLDRDGTTTAPGLVRGLGQVECGQGVVDVDPRRQTVPDTACEGFE